MKKTVTVLAIFALAGAAFGNGIALNSPGTRALAMGGAYISIADDYSAPYWNPAGLQNGDGMQATFFLTDIIPLAKYERSPNRHGILPRCFAKNHQVQISSCTQ